MNAPHHGSPLYFGYGKEWQQPYVWGPWLSKFAKRKAVKYIGTAASISSNISHSIYKNFQKGTE